MKASLQLITIAILSSISAASSHAAGPPPIEDPINRAGILAGIDIVQHCTTPLFSNSASTGYATCNDCIRELCYRTFMNPELSDPYSQVDIYLCEADRRNAGACIAFGEFFCPAPMVRQPEAVGGILDFVP